MAPLAAMGIKLPSEQFSWKPLPKLWEERGVVVEGWPEDVQFPCDNLKNKGISGVPVRELQILLDAFDHPTHPLKMVRKYTSGMSIQPVGYADLTHRWQDRYLTINLLLLASHLQSIQNILRDVGSSWVKGWTKTDKAFLESLVTTHLHPKKSLSPNRQRRRIDEGNRRRKTTIHQAERCLSWYQIAMMIRSRTIPPLDILGAPPKRSNPQSGMGKEATERRMPQSRKRVGHWASDVLVR